MRLRDGSGPGEKRPGPGRVRRSRRGRAACLPARARRRWWLREGGGPGDYAEPRVWGRFWVGRAVLQRRLWVTRCKQVIFGLHEGQVVFQRCLATSLRGDCSVFANLRHGTPAPGPLPQAGHSRAQHHAILRPAAHSHKPATSSASGPPHPSCAHSFFFSPSLPQTIPSTPLHSHTPQQSVSAAACAHVPAGTAASPRR